MREARALGLEVIDRCNLTVLQEPGQEDLPAFLAAHQARSAARAGPAPGAQHADRAPARLQPLNPNLYLVLY